MSTKRNIIILGSTGSIGESTLKVLRYQSLENKKDSKANPYNYNILGLFANSNIKKLVEQILEYTPKVCGIFNKFYLQQLTQYLEKAVTEGKLNKNRVPVILSGREEIHNYITNDEVDVVVGAIVGFAGLESSLISINADKVLLLANKESLVAGGNLIKKALKEHPKAQLIPVDSEHNAIFQAMPVDVQKDICNCNIQDSGVRKIILTGSGGPFLNRPLEDFHNITIKDALNHPNWSMGSKISIDSSTMMNKGLEFIEAAVLFSCEAKDIETIIHPQSIVHSGVEYKDRSLIVQMGPTDMCVPIAYALNYPFHGSSSVDSLNLCELSGLTFQKVDFNRYPNFLLAQEAYSKGLNFTCILNAANEISVAAFLDNKISYLDIFKVNKSTLEKFAKNNIPEANTYKEIVYLDKLGRSIADSIVEDLSLNK